MKRFCTILSLCVALAMTGCNSHKPDPAAEPDEVKRIASILTAKDVASTEVVGAAATGWGSLKGKITLSAKPAPPGELTCNKDEGTCCREKLIDNSLLVGSGNGVQNVFVFLRSKGKTPVRVHDNYAKQKGTEVLLDNSKCMFHPHCAALWTEQKLMIKNSDNVGHNTKYDSSIQGFNDLLNVGGAPLEKKFKAGENKPAGLSCSIHPWMQAKLLVRDNPYFALTNENGEFEIPNMPAGEELEITFWHEKNEKLTKASGAMQLKGGVLRVKLPENQTTDVAFVFEPAEFGSK